MGLALDSSIVDALVLYVSEENGKPVYIAGEVTTSELPGTADQSKPVVAIQYRTRSVEPAVEESAKTAVSQHHEVEIVMARQATDNATETDTKSIVMKPAVTVAAAKKAVTSSAPAKNEQPKSAKSLPDNSYQPPPSDDKSPSALSYIEAIAKNKWEYATLLDRYIVRYDEQTYIVLTIRPALQKMLEGVFKKYSTRISAGIIQDPSTGEILAMTSSHRNQTLDILSDKYKKENWALRPTFPVASIFKIITAAAGLDSGKTTAKSSFRAWGKTYMTVWKAFASSHNGVYGRIARKTGRTLLKKYAEAFGFNKPFFFDLPVDKSLANLPTNSVKFGQAAAGLNRDFLVSPIHVAQIISTVLNRGRTMKPYLVDYVVRKNEIVFRRKPFQLAQPIKVSTAKDIYKMMYATTAVGTGKRGFGGYRKCPNLSKICGGKTGTLTGASPHYLFTWFGGFTRATGRDLCIVTLSGQKNHSGTKASSIAGQIAYELYMKRHENYKPAQIAKKN
jgi:membrane peptidoglycan carboxypeptidase